ncbi:MAG: M20 family metallo-hydrolase [Candidatus Krumholzibacteriia bacterium]
MNDSVLKRLTTAIDGYEKESVRLQTELCKLPALGPENEGQGEDAKAKFLKRYLENIGVTDIRQYNAPDKRVPCGYRPNLVAVVPGKVSSPRLWIMTHMDVVPPGDLSKWTGDPWNVRVDGDKVIGRGTEDNQQGMVSSLLAARAFHETGMSPRLPFGLILCADEETGSKFGVQYLLDTEKDLFGKDDLIIIPDAGDSQGTMVEVAEKSILWVRFHTSGKQTHASTPEKGVNAHKAACYLATRLDTLYEKFGDSDGLFDPPISTFEPTKRAANVPNVNTIPGEDVFYFDCRVLPGYQLGDVIEAITEFVRETEKRYQVTIAMEYPQKESAAPPTPHDAPVAVAIARAVEALRDRKPKPMGIGGGTVGKYFREAGYNCAIWATQDENAHAPDEYCRISAMLDDAKVFAHVALQG